MNKRHTPPVFTSRNRSWAEGQAKTITFILTHACQLRCRYCYLQEKNPLAKMTAKVAQAAIDYLLDHPALFPERAVILDFIGGEPLLNIEVMDEIADRFRFETWRRKHPWFDRFRFCITTNGLRYSSTPAQEFIRRNRRHLSITVTIDGTKEKHDANRVFPDGRGSYDAVAEIVPQWLSQFPHESTKVTVASADLPFLRDSVIHLWDLGIKNVNLNTVFEDVWREGDDAVYEEQLLKLVDAYVGNERYHDCYCSVFSDSIGKPLDPKLDNRNWCGAGKMLAVDCDGSFYPCVRFAPFSLTRRQFPAIGNCFDGLAVDRLRPFLTLDRVSQSPEACVTCKVASGCGWCQGYNFESAGSDTIFERSRSGCAMHKARVRANVYLRIAWKKRAS